MNKRVLWIVAGANGAGKTSSLNISEINDFSHLLFKNADPIPFINPDIIATKLFPNTNPKDYTEAEKIKAGRAALKKRKELLSKNNNLAIETTYSGNSTLSLIKQARKNDYTINIVYYGLESVEDHINRVQKRVQQGGHFISHEEIERRRISSLKNITDTWQLASNLYVFDNSHNQRKVLAKIVNNEIVSLASKFPDWFKEAHKAIKLEQDKIAFLSNPKVVTYEVPFTERYEAFTSGLYFNNFLRKYTEQPSSNLSLDQKEKWAVTAHINHEFFDKKIIPKLNSYLEEQGFRKKESLSPIANENLLLEKTYQDIISSGQSLEEITERDAKLVLNPTIQNTKAYIIGNDNQLISTWNYREKINEANQEQSNFSSHQDRLKKQEESYYLASDKAQIIYDHLQPIKSYFDYFKTKQIIGGKDIKYIAFKDKEYFKEAIDWSTRYNQMVIPIRNWDKQLRSLQIISEDGSWKGFLTDGEIKGNFATIGKEDPRKANKIIIAEGYATAASIHESTGIPVVVAFQANNLLPVAKQFGDKNPAQTIYIGADNDYKSFIKEAETPQNVGLQTAILTAEEVDGKVLYPPINLDNKATALKGWDWNDYAVHYNKAETRKELLSQINGISEVTVAIDDIPHTEEAQYFSIKKNKQASNLTITEDKTLYIHQTNGIALKVPHVVGIKNQSHFFDLFKNLGYSVEEQKKVNRDKFLNSSENNPLKNTQGSLSSKNKILHTEEVKEVAFKDMSPKLQSFYHAVIESAEKKAFTTEQMNVLELRLRPALQELHKKELKQKAHEQEK